MKIRFLFCFILICAYSFAGGISGDKYVPINLSTVLKLAGANSLTIHQYELEYEQTLAQIDKAREWFLPNIFIGPSIHYLKGATIQTTGQLLENVTQRELWLGGGISGEWDFSEGIFNVMARKQHSQAVKMMNAAERNKVILDAVGDYYDLLMAQVIYNQKYDLLKQADTLKTQIKVQVDAGLRYQSEYLLAQSNYNHIAIDLFNAQIEMQKKSDALLNILNIDTTARLISSDTNMVPIDMVKGITDTGITSYSQYTKARPEYQSMEAELNSIQDEKKTTTIGLLMPKLAIGTPDAMFGTFGPPFYNSYKLDAQLLWNISIGRIIYKGDLKLYNSELQQEQNNMLQFSNDVRQQIKDARSQIILAMQQMNLSKNALSQSGDALKQSIERERLGTVLPFEVFQTEQFYVQAELDYVKTVGDYNKAQYALYVAMGNNL